MKLAATKTLAKELNKMLKTVENSSILEIRGVNYSEAEYKWYVDINTYAHDDDYNFNSEEFRVIKILYDFDCYAMPNYCTTKDLTRIFRKCPNKTLDELFTAFLEEYEI